MVQAVSLINSSFISYFRERYQPERLFLLYIYSQCKVVYITAMTICYNIWVMKVNIIFKKATLVCVEFELMDIDLSLERYMYFIEL